MTYSKYSYSPLLSSIFLSAFFHTIIYSSKPFNCLITVLHNLLTIPLWLYISFTGFFLTVTNNNTKNSHP